MNSEARILDVSQPASLNLRHGRFEATSFLVAEGTRQSTHLALVAGRLGNKALLRIASACLTGEVFGCDRCDCARQLDLALELIAGEGCGLLTYHPTDEGYGLGLHKKICTYAASGGAGKREATSQHGALEDARTFAPAALIVASFGLGSVRLLSANERKRAALEAHGIEAQLTPHLLHRS